MPEIAATCRRYRIYARMIRATLFFSGANSVDSAAFLLVISTWTFYAGQYVLRLGCRILL